MADGYSAVRKDASGVPLDYREVEIIGTTPQYYLPGVGIQAAYDPIAAPAGVAVTGGSGQISVAYTPVAGAAFHVFRYYLTSAGVGTAITKVVNASPVVITGLAAGAYTASVQAVFRETSHGGADVIGTWGTATGTAS